MPLNDRERSLAPRFDRAMELRDRGRIEEAAELLSALIEDLTTGEPLLLAHSHMQLGRIHERLGQSEQCHQHFRAAVDVAPKLELASLGLFHALDNLGRSTDALREMVRYVTARDSDMYRELLCEGYGDGMQPHDAELVAEARLLLARHRRN